MARLTTTSLVPSAASDKENTVRRDEKCGLQERFWPGDDAVNAKKQAQFGREGISSQRHSAANGRAVRHDEEVGSVAPTVCGERGVSKGE